MGSLELQHYSRSLMWSTGGGRIAIKRCSVMPMSMEMPVEGLVNLWSQEKFVKIWQPKAGLVQYIVYNTMHECIIAKPLMRDMRNTRW